MFIDKLKIILSIFQSRKLLQFGSFFIVLIAIPLTVFLVQQKLLNPRAAEKEGVDLDVTYIERTPRYWRYQIVKPYVAIPRIEPGTENQKHWPDPGEEITYTVHVINKGKKASQVFTFKWFLNGNEVDTGISSSLNPGAEAVFTYRMNWPGVDYSDHSNETLTFHVYPTNSDSNQFNDRVTIYPKGLSLAFWIRQDWYDKFNSYPNGYGSYSFEDWLQWQIEKLNELFALSTYPLTPNGILERVNVDKIIIIPTPKSSSKYDATRIKDAMKGDNLLDKEKFDMHWELPRWTDENPYGSPDNPESLAWLNSIISTTDWALLHEFGHQLGLIDLYQMHQEKRDTGKNPLGLFWHFPNGGIMGGGDTEPHYNDKFFDSHSAYALNQHLGYRRGYYGEYLFDIPRENWLQIFDKNSQLLAGASIEIYQRDAYDTNETLGKVIFKGKTNSQGYFFLPNRPDSGSNGFKTETGHTVLENPFWVISVNGNNGLFVIKIEKENKTDYQFLPITEFNLAFWRGEKDSAIYRIFSNLNSISDLIPSPISVSAPIPSPSPMISPTITPTQTPVRSSITLPSSFYGRVTFNGTNNVASGTPVGIYIDNSLVGSVKTQNFQGNSVYTIPIVGDDPATSQREGGREGDAIIFKVANFEASPKGIWHSGTNTELNLNINIP